MHDSVSDHLSVAVQIVEDGHAVHVTLVGDLDADTVDRARAEIHAALAEAGTDVVVDGVGLDFVDVAGLNLIADLALRVRGEGGSVCLRGARPMLVRMLQETGLDTAVTLDA